MSQKPRRFLVVYDGSTLADRALDYALGQAEDGLTVLVAIPPPLTRAKTGQFQVPMESHDDAFARAQIERAAARCAERGTSFEARVRTGPPADVIAEEAREFDVLVIGRRANPWGARPLADLVRERVDCEVVLI